MLLDKELQLSADQAVTASAATTNIIDLGAVRNLGVGMRLYALCIVKTAFTDGASDSTVAVTLETDDNEAFASATSRQSLGTFAALSAAGSRLIAALLPDVINERYLRGYYTVAGGNLTTGALDFYITQDADFFTSYPGSYTIDY